jgi:hypothetical protein
VKNEPEDGVVEMIAGLFFYNHLPRLTYYEFRGLFCEPGTPPSKGGETFVLAAKQRQ